MIKLVIVHFAPLELYPPTQNLLHELEKKGSASKLIVITTRPVADSDLFRANSNSIKIIRLGVSGRKDDLLRRYLGYMYFYTTCLMLLCRHLPERIMYFETLSSWPVYFFKRFLKRDAEVLIHYHEYTSPEECQNGMWLTKYFHRRERWLYPHAVWISHTNKFRIDLFEKDIGGVANLQIVPNYPPQSWQTSPKKTITLPVKIVYVGALSLETMFTRSFAEWVVQQQGKVVWDIYSSNYVESARKYLEELGTEFVNFSGGVNYDQLPLLLKKYDVGVILYNGHIPNYVYNAPNKLFEYLACGLDVWFPDVMIGTRQYERNFICPKVLSINFSQLSDFDFESAIERAGQLVDSSYFCEDALIPLITKLLK